MQYEKKHEVPDTDSSPYPLTFPSTI